MPVPSPVAPPQPRFASRRGTARRPGARREPVLPRRIDPAPPARPAAPARAGRPWLPVSLLLHLALVAALLLWPALQRRVPEPLPPPAFDIVFEGGQPERPLAEPPPGLTGPPLPAGPPPPAAPPSPAAPPPLAATPPPPPPAPFLPAPPAPAPVPPAQPAPAPPAPASPPAPAPPPSPAAAAATPPAPAPPVPLPAAAAPATPAAPPPPAPPTPAPPTPAPATPPRAAEAPPAARPAEPAPRQAGPLPLPPPPAPPVPAPRPAAPARPAQPARPQTAAPALPDDVLLLPESPRFGAAAPPAGRPAARGLDLSVDPRLAEGRASADPRMRVTGAQVGADWRAAFRRWLEENIRYPRRAAELGESGPVRVRITADPDGRVRNVALVGPSASPSLNLGTLLPFEGARLPPFPPPHDPAGITIDLTVDYILIRR